MNVNDITNKPIQQLTDVQKSVLFDYAVEQKLVKQADVNRFASQISKDIAESTERLRRMNAAVGNGSTLYFDEITHAAAARYAPRKSTAGRPRIARGVDAPSTRASQPNRKRLASRKLQGRYLALVRQFPKSARAKYSKIAKSVNREAAIAQMEKDLKTKS